MAIDPLGPPPSAPPSHQSFDADQKPQKGQQYPPNERPYPPQYPPNQQPGYPQQYPPNQQPGYPQQDPPNQQPPNQQSQARENEQLVLGVIIMVCCFPFSLCCIPCLFPNACGGNK